MAIRFSKNAIGIYKNTCGMEKKQLLFVWSYWRLDFVVCYNRCVCVCVCVCVTDRQTDIYRNWEINLHWIKLVIVVERYEICTLKTSKSTFRVYLRPGRHSVISVRGPSLNQRTRVLCDRHAQLPAELRLRMSTITTMMTIMKIIPWLSGMNMHVHTRTHTHIPPGFESNMGLSASSWEFSGLAIKRPTFSVWWSKNSLDFNMLLSDSIAKPVYFYFWPTILRKYKLPRRNKSFPLNICPKGRTLTHTDRQTDRQTHTHTHTHVPNEIL